MLVTTTWILLKKTYTAWSDNKASRLGAALAFYSVLSLGPLLLLVLVAASSIWSHEAAQGQIVEQMTGLVGDQGAQAIKTILQTAAENKHSGILATIAGVVTLIFSASGVFGELQDAMNMIWEVPPPKEKPWIVLLRDRFLSFTMVVGCGFLLLISLVVSAVLAAISSYAGHQFPSLTVVMPAIDFVFSFVTITILFALTFKVVPDTKIAWSNVWPAAILTSILFLIGKSLIGFYLSHAGVVSSYGAAGSVVILLIWIYYSAQILFFGAEFAHVYSRLKG